MNKLSRRFLILSSILLALAVGFGAFGAHIIQDMVTAERFAVYQTGVQYHFYHALGLMIIGLAALHMTQNKLLKWSGYSMILGIIIFSGSLYLLTLTDTGWLGAITPVGGIAFISGWILFALAIIRQQSND
jgi:uncharacterized membrane protein YgdD (TMEM256/DUF423 family)